MTLTPQYAPEAVYEALAVTVFSATVVVIPASVFVVVTVTVTC
jgi:hypothetical protein